MRKSGGNNLCRLSRSHQRTVEYPVRAWDIPGYTGFVKAMTAKSYIVATRTGQLAQAVIHPLFGCAMSPNGQNHCGPQSTAYPAAIVSLNTVPHRLCSWSIR
jgi:hypothetical protein